MPTIDHRERADLPVISESMRTYLERRLGGGVRILGSRWLGGESAADVKEYGYGAPVKIDFECRSERRAAVLETIRPGPFGHEHMADRAQTLLWSHAAYNALPRHVRALDVGAFVEGGQPISLADAKECFIVTEFVRGDGYQKDLERLRDGGELRGLDLERADALCDYLVEIHRVAGSNPDLYVRRIRELVGGNECIAGVLDSYPASLVGATGVLEAIEQACVRWRWRLKPLTHRLRQVHGDFHPWNILFREGSDFTVLDRSRGEWGDPADDVAALTMNYFFFSLQRHRRLVGPLGALFTRFWSRYLEASGDREILEVVAPFLAFRGLVMASPVWYPHLAPSVRETLLTFIRSVLEQRRFEPLQLYEYCHA